MTPKVTVTLDKEAVKARVEAAAQKCTAVFANELLKDANFYCREDSGELIRSSIRASKPEEGLLIWDTPYAKRMYFTGRPVTDRNPNASLMWVHRAANENKDKYIRMLKKIIKQEV